MEQLKIKRDQQLGLMEAMDFSDKDLEANRSGVLSEDQRHRIQFGQIWGALGWWIIAAIGTVQLVNPEGWFPENTANRLACLVMVLCGLGMAFWRQSQIEEVVKENKVAVRTGPIKKTIRTENKSQVYRASIGGRKFEVNKRTYDWLVEDREYSCYYVPQNGTLLSIGRPLTAEEKIQFSFTRERDFEKEKRFVENDTLMSDAATVDNNTTQAHLSEGK